SLVLAPECLSNIPWQVQIHEVCTEPVGGLARLRDPPGVLFSYGARLVSAGSVCSASRAVSVSWVRRAHAFKRLTRTLFWRLAPQLHGLSRLVFPVNPNGRTAPPKF